MLTVARPDQADNVAAPQLRRQPHGGGAAGGPDVGGSAAHHDLQRVREALMKRMGETGGCLTVARLCPPSVLQHAREGTPRRAPWWASWCTPTTGARKTFCCSTCAACENARDAGLACADSRNGAAAAWVPSRAATGRLRERQGCDCALRRRVPRQQGLLRRGTRRQGRDHLLGSCGRRVRRANDARAR